MPKLKTIPSSDQQHLDIDTPSNEVLELEDVSRPEDVVYSQASANDSNSRSQSSPSREEQKARKALEKKKVESDRPEVSPVLPEIDKENNHSPKLQKADPLSKSAMNFTPASASASKPKRDSDDMTDEINALSDERVYFTSF